MFVYILRSSRLLNTLEQFLLRLDVYLIVEVKVKKKSLSLKYNPKLYFLSTHILEYIISSTDSLNELVNSNDNHVHTIIVELREPLGLS